MLEEHLNDTERKLRSVEGESERFSAAYAQLEEHSRTVEAERNALQAQLQKMIDQVNQMKSRFEELSEEFYRVKDDGAKVLEENAKKLIFYDLMKKLLTRLRDHADHAFLPEFMTRYGEELAKFVDQLPD